MNTELPNPGTARRPAEIAPPLSPRRRRLRWTAAVLALMLLAVAAAGLLMHLRSRTALYQPGEASADITSSLSRSLPREAPRPSFTDVTDAAGLSAFRAFPGPRTSQLPEDMGAGAAWGDFDNDGDDDLFLVSAGGPMNVAADELAASELYANLGGGRFQKVEAFPELRIRGMSAAFGDYDSDGFLDLAVAGYDTLILLHNEQGTGKFIRSPAVADRKGFWAGVSWGDYDNDRRLDLYVCGYVRYLGNEADRVRTSSQLGTAVPYTLNPASYQPEGNLLFHNDPAGTFTEVAQELGVDNPVGRSLSALWHDFDDDGWLDLYVANDIAGSVFYHNTGGKFEDLSEAAWVADYRSAMGLAAGDYNRDGDDDLFVSHWIAQENALFENLWCDFKDVPGPASGNRAASGKLAESATPPHPQPRPKPHPLRFMDANEAKGLGQIALPFVGWGAEFVDLDADGWLDLVVANGNTLEEPGPFPRRLKPQEAFLFWNQQGRFFHNLAPLNPALSRKGDRRGLAVADHDDDGAMDLLFVDLTHGAQLLRNEMQSGHWIKVRLRSRTASGETLGFGDGAKVIANVGGTALRRTVSSASYLSQSSRVLHFGLGSASQVDTLEVRWLGGEASCFTNLAANTFWELTEGSPVPVRAPARARTETPPKPPQPHQRSAGGKRVLEFWAAQRAAMDALKIEKDIPKATGLLRQALELNPDHEDSRYYLGNCLAMQNDWTGALEQLQQLTRINPQSHRGHSQWGTLRAISAQSEADLQAAEESLERAHRINPEETGALLVLGEVALLRGNLAAAEERFTRACRTNPKAVGGFFVRGYLAWKRGELTAARDLLAQARGALGPDWQPKGTTSEGDVRQRWHTETTPLSRFWDEWDGNPEPGKAFAKLDQHLQQPR